MPRPPDISIPNLYPNYTPNTLWAQPPKTPGPSGTPVIILVIGAPGSGKGTLCKNEPVKNGYTHISVGDHLRELCREGTESTAAQRGGMAVPEIKEAMEKTSLLPAKSLMAILKAKLLEEYGKGSKKFMIDGFPRTLESARVFESEIIKPSDVFLISCGKETAKSRFLARRREESDSETKFEARYQQFLEEIDAILGWYGALVSTIDTECSEAESHNTMLREIYRADGHQEKGFDWGDWDAPQWHADPANRAAVEELMAKLRVPKAGDESKHSTS